MLLVLAGDLEAGLVRFRSRVDEIGVVAAAHQFVDLFGQRRGRRVHRGVRKIGKLPHLIGGDRGEFAAPVADIDAPQPGHAVEILGPIGIDDRRALAAGNDHLLGFQRLVLDDRMQDVAEILLHDRGSHRGVGRVQQRHGSLAERVVENG